MNGGARGKFVGRADELALLDESLTAARAGRPGVVVVEGEPGIGKTALRRQAVRLAPAASVVWASGLSLGTPDRPGPHADNLGRRHEFHA